MPGIRRTDLHTALARTLKARRNEANLSQEELAAKIGRQQSYISKLERGERRLDAVELLEVVDAIGCPIGPIFDELRAAREAERQAQDSRAKARATGQGQREPSSSAPRAAAPRTETKPRTR